VEDMKNPLIKRLPRELKEDIGKFLVIFLFLTATIGFISGFLVADGSMKRAYDDSFEKYNIEDGHFILAALADKDLIDEIKELGTEVYELFYTEKETEGGHILRIYPIRKEVNKASLLEGRLPESDKEIVIDRLYAMNNDISVGDQLTVDGEELTITGFVALSDYSALFKNNTDMMFDAQKFSIAMVTEETFENYDGGLHYCYAWTNEEKDLSEKEKKEFSEDILECLTEHTVVTDFVKRADNQAIMFTGDDMGSDKAMMTWMLYVVIAVLAFVFAVTTNSTIEKEATVIGTLRASGFTRGELVRHYMTLPVLVFLAAAVVGNILGYTLFKGVVVDMYYGSYSLPAYETIWNAEAFILTTVVPCIIMLVVNAFMLTRKLTLSPLKFLRRDLRKDGRQRVVRLPNFKFITRFRLRIILQNMPVYVIMMIGIFLANILLFFGMIMSPLLQHFKEDVIQNQIAEYQYVLKVPVEIEEGDAEKYAVQALKMKDSEEEITVYGISEDSDYFNMKLSSSEKEAVLADGFMEKYGISTGDEVTLKEKYGNKSYTFTVVGSYHYPATLSVFISLDQFNEIFDKEDGYFSGYFSDEKLEEIDEAYIASIITEHDLTIITDQLEDSMGKIFPMFGAFSVLLYMLMIYLLSKLILEKNAASISMVKILGYTGREVGRLYLASTAIVVLVSLFLSIPVSLLTMKGIYYMIMQSFSGWLTFYVRPDIYFWLPVIGIVSYFVISLLHFRKIKRIPMEEALKNAE
jgi:putative ABC transport system permease protein